MGNLLYVVAVILIILWAIGFLGYDSGGIIHILLVIAVIAILNLNLQNPHLPILIPVSYTHLTLPTTPYV